MNVRERASSKDLAGSRIPALFDSRTLKQLALTALMAFTVLIFSGEAAYAAAPPPSVNCTNGQTPNMTIVIYNTRNSITFIRCCLPALRVLRTPGCKHVSRSATQISLPTHTHGPPNIACTSIAAPRERTAFRRAVR
jgi:hypothetical protein